MFEPGTKVILVESSLHKATGPRKGSIGYVSNCSFTHAIPTAVEGLGTFNVVASLCEILFIRFGFEEHSRIERKNVISVFPLIKNGRLFDKGSGNKKEIDKDRYSIDKNIKDFCSMIATQKESYLWENVRCSCEVSSSVPITLATPINYDTTDLTTCKEVEFRAWVISYLNNLSMYKFIDNSIKSLHYTNYNDADLHRPEIWNHLQSLTNDRDYRQDYINSHSVGPEERKECILLIRKLMSTISRLRLKNIKRSVEEIPVVCSYDFLNACYNIIGPYLYNNVAISLFINIIKRTNSPNIADEMTSTITECMSLSDSMFQ